MMKMHTRLRTSVAAVALALTASTGFAMAPVDEYGRNYQGGVNASMGNDDFGNAVRSREFSDTRALESSGRGSAIDQEGSSAYRELYSAESETRPWEPGPQSDASGISDESGVTGSRSVSGQAAINQQLSPPDTIGSDVAGSGYTKDSDLIASTETAPGEKLVVIVPRGWEGSVPTLVSALEHTSDDAAVIVIDEGRERAATNAGEQGSLNQE